MLSIDKNYSCIGWNVDFVRFHEAPAKLNEDIKDRFLYYIV